MIKKINILKVENSLLVLAIISLLVYFMVYPVVSYDSGYYMSIMREMHQGRVYFKDIATPYNPLGISILSFPFYFSYFPDFRWSLLINIIAVLGSSCILYKILSTFKISNLLKRFLQLFFIILCFTHDGNHIMLEPISVFFQLLAVYGYILHRNIFSLKKILLVGVFLGLSFLTKQYALFLLAPIGIDILLRKKAIFKETLALALGLIIPIFLLYAYYYFNSVSLYVFFKSILGKGVHLDIGTGTGIDSYFKFSNLTNFVFMNAFLVLIPFFLKNKKVKTEDLVFYTLMALMSFSVFIFANYNHYFQYTFPYFLILFAYSASFTENIIQNRYFQILSLVAILKIGFLSASTIKHQRRNYIQQTYDMKIINKHIPSGSAVYLNGLSPAYYYLCNFKSIQLNRIGFSFPGYFYPDSIIEAMKPGDYLAITEPYLESFDTYKEQFTIKEVTLRDNHFYLYKKNEPTRSNKSL